MTAFHFLSKMRFLFEFFRLFAIFVCQFGKSPEAAASGSVYEFMKNLILQWCRTALAAAVCVSAIVSCETYPSGGGSSSSGIVGMWAVVEEIGGEPTDYFWQDVYLFDGTFYEFTADGIFNVCYFYDSEAQCSISGGEVAGVTREDIVISDTYEYILSGQWIMMEGTPYCEVIFFSSDRLMLRQGDEYQCLVRCTSLGSYEPDGGNDSQMTGCNPYEDFGKLVRRLTSIEPSGESYFVEYEYDDCGRMTRYVEYYGTLEVFTCVMEYYDDRVVCGFYGDQETQQTMYVDESGLITGVQNSSGDIWYYTYTDGCLTGISGSSTGTNTWENGNLLSGETLTMSGTYSYYYYENKMNVDFFSFGPRFKGHMSRDHFMQCGSSIFTYEFDDEGFATKVTEQYKTSDGSVEEYVYEILYY